MRNAIIKGTGSYLPPFVLKNDDFPKHLDTCDEWIRTRTGIRERRMASPDETAMTLAREASQRALEAAGLAPTDLDLIVFATVTPDAMVPSTACMLQAELGCRQIGAFDVSGACSGFLHAFAIGQQFIKGGMCRNVLVVGSEVMTRMVDYQDRSTCVLFGDGAGACILSLSETPGVGIRQIRMYSDGTRGDFIQMPSNVSNHPSAPFTHVDRAPRYPDAIQLNGRQVYQFAVETIGSLIRETLEMCELPPEQIAAVIPHQVNQRIIDSAFRDLPISVDKVVVNLDRYGNTAAASVPIALDEAIRSERVGPGDTIFLVAFGGGLSWCSAVVTL